MENLRENDQMNLNGCQKVYRQLLLEIKSAQRKNYLEGSDSIDNSFLSISPPHNKKS